MVCIYLFNSKENGVCVIIFKKIYWELLESPSSIMRDTGENVRP